jgi:hypothetical protein
MSNQLLDYKVPKGTIIIIGESKITTSRESTISQLLNGVKGMYRDFKYGGFIVQDNTITFLAYNERDDLNGSLWCNKSVGKNIFNWTRYRVTNPNFLKALNPESGTILQIKGLGDLVVNEVNNGDNYITLDIQ